MVDREEPVVSKDPGKGAAYGVDWEEGEKLDYVTLAKSGGRRDLLCHMEFCRNDIVSDPSFPASVDWFAHPSPPPRHTPSPYQSPLKEHWFQWHQKSSPKLPQLVQQPGKGGPSNVNINRRKSDKTKHKSNISPTKLPVLAGPTQGRDGIDFGRLLSLDYQREWLDKREKKKEEQHRKAKARKLAQKKKLQEHSMKGRRGTTGGADNSQTSPGKQRFIMKRFADVPPKLKLPPI